MIASNAATVGFGDRPDRPRMRLVSFKPVTKGNLRGFATVELPIGLTIFDCRVLVGNNGPWAVLPSKPVLDSEERHVKRDGRKGQYAPVLQWRDKDLTNRFSDTLVALVLEDHPDGLDGAS
jgi:hypothetical protein